MLRYGLGELSYLLPDFEGSSEPSASWAGTHSHQHPTAPLLDAGSAENIPQTRLCRSVLCPDQESSHPGENRIVYKGTDQMCSSFVPSLIHRPATGRPGSQLVDAAFPFALFLDRWGAVILSQVLPFAPRKSFAVLPAKAPRPPAEVISRAPAKGSHPPSLLCFSSLPEAL